MSVVGACGLHILFYWGVDRRDGVIGNRGLLVATKVWVSLGCARFRLGFPVNHGGHYAPGQNNNTKSMRWGGVRVGCGWGGTALANAPREVKCTGNDVK